MANEAKKKFSFKEYFKSVRVEMKKVVWPTKKETIQQRMNPISIKDVGVRKLIP
mgnify:CR=1 FL=1